MGRLGPRRIIMRTVAIVQARMGSKRFPGKMLSTLDGHSVLEWVLRRVSRSRRLDEVVLATSDLPRDDALVEVARTCGVRTFRGSEDNVLDRFCSAGDAFGAQLVVRVCADNPFVDPAEIDRLIEFHLNNKSDLSCNHQDRLGSKYADGFGAEVLSLNTLRSIADCATEPRHREHVTLYIWEHPDDYIISGVPAPVGLAFPQLRFDVDRPSDLVYLKSLCRSGVSIDSTAIEIVLIALKS